MKGEFVKWTQRGKKITKPFLRLYRDGTMYLSGSCDEMLNFPTCISLWFNEATRQVGLKACEPDEEGAYKIHRHSRTNRASISCKSFCRAHQIDYEGKFFAKKERGLVVFWVGGPEPGEDDEDEAE